MDLEAIRKVFSRRPFTPLDLWLDSGDKVRVSSPEPETRHEWAAPRSRAALRVFGVRVPSSRAAPMRPPHAR